MTDCIASKIAIQIYVVVENIEIEDTSEKTTVVDANFKINPMQAITMFMVACNVTKEVDDDEKKEEIVYNDDFKKAEMAQDDDYLV